MAEDKKIIEEAQADSEQVRTPRGQDSRGAERS